MGSSPSSSPAAPWLWLSTRGRARLSEQCLGCEWSCFCVLLWDQPSSLLQWSYGFYLIHLQGKQGFQFFCKTEEMKRKWMEQFEMAM